MNLLTFDYSSKITGGIVGYLETVPRMYSMIKDFVHNLEIGDLSALQSQVNRGLMATAVVLTMFVQAANASSTEFIKPSQANPSVEQHDTPNVVITRDSAVGSAQGTLAVFLPGTGGQPENVLPLLNTISRQGYTVIGLSYNDEPSLSKICPQDPNPQCSAKFREIRSFGTGKGPVENSRAESIANRLIDLLHYLDRIHPEAGWSTYLTADGNPAWNRILVSGLSQGAGMAAFIAKRYQVYRVVLFSSPWDVTGRNRRPAPWLSGQSATPPDRWWAERHVQENTTDLIAHAYGALRIPSDHILLFRGGLLPQQHPGTENPYHSSTVRNINYADQWKVLYGEVFQGG